MKPFATYQHLEGLPMTDRDKGEVGSAFWNEGKFNNFVKPFLPEDPSEMTFVDVGCNAGVFLKEAEDYGFKTVIGVDSDKLAVERGKSWAEQHSRNYKLFLVEMENVVNNLPLADYTVLANVHYYFSINDWLDYLDRLQYKTRYCIIVTAKKQRPNRCWAKTDIPSIRKYFQSWKEVGYTEGPSLENDPHPRQLWGLCFESPHLKRTAIDELDSGNHVQDEFYAELDEGKDYKNTRYYRILKPYRTKAPHNWPIEKLDIWFEGRVKLYKDVKENGLLKPTLIDENKLILDGNHKTQMMKHLGYKTIITREV